MKHRKGRLLTVILTLILLSACGGDPVPAASSELSVSREEADRTAPVETELTSCPSDDLLVQGPALRLGHDDVFEIYKRTAEPGISHQSYRTHLPYESHSKSMLSYYVEEHLLGEVGLTLLRQDETEIEGRMLSILCFTHPGAEVIPGTDYCLMLAFCEGEEGGTEILIDCSDRLTLEEWDATGHEEPEPETEPEPDFRPEQEAEPKPAPAMEPDVLPDFLKTGTDYEVSSSTTSRVKVYTADHMDIGCVETYLELLLDMGYTVVHTEEDSNPWGGVYRLWELAHADVDAAAISTRGAQITVESSTYGTWDDQTLSIEFSAGITMSGEDGGPSPSSEAGYVDCPGCYSGSCTACGGNKGKYSYSPGLPREWEECWKCNGTGRCSKCGGFGRIFG